jgi:putative toxin-antitoxin system antitoxin component (TIGR02293 family)
MPLDPIFEAFGMKRPATGSGKAAGKKAPRVKSALGYHPLPMVAGKRGRAIPGQDRDKASQAHAAEIVVQCRFDGLTGLSIVTDAPSGRTGMTSAEVNEDGSVEAFDVVVVGNHIFQIKPAALKWLHNYTDDEIHTLVVPKRTLARRVAAREPLSVEETDKAVRLGRIDRLAAEIFGDPAKAHRWLRKAKRSLGNETPLAYLATEAGARAVEEMLNQIDHGILA